MRGLGQERVLRYDFTCGSAGEKLSSVVDLDGDHDGEIGDEVGPVCGLSDGFVSCM